MLISDQAIELAGWETAYLHELRDPHGRWTKSPSSPSGFAVPPHSRLVIDKGPYPDPADHPFFKRHPVSSASIVSAWDKASPLQVMRGMRWYSDAQTLAKVIGDGDVHKGASVLSAYSPQSAWQVDMMNAAMSLAADKAVGGKGSGLMVTDDMKRMAERALSGEPTDEVFNAPKTRAFARLIEHGGDAPGEPFGDVVIDRHALSVALGTVLPKKEADTSPIGKLRFYEHVADQYRIAASEISKRDGIRVSPSQVQAATWLWRQELNQARDKAGEDRLQRGRETAQRNAWAAWTRYGWEHPEIPAEIGTTSMPGSALAGKISPGGFSVSLASGQSPRSGYMVAFNDHTHTYPASIVNDQAALADAIDQMLMSESSVFGKDGMHLGGWVHDGKLWLEPSENIADKAQAEATARQRNQIAIWDVSAGQEIQTGGTGGGQIFGHANAQSRNRADPPGLFAPAGSRAQGNRAPPGWPDQGWPVTISGQLDLASDAWRHELRGPHGEWVRSAVPRETGAQIRDIYRRLRESYDEAGKQGVIADDIKETIQRAGTAYDNGDYEHAAALMREAARSMVFQGVGDVAVKWEELAHDLQMLRGVDIETPTRKAVTDLAGKTAPKVPGLLGGGHEIWSGKITLFPQSDNPAVSAQIDWGGDIHMSSSVARMIADSGSGTGSLQSSDINAHLVMLHELIHGVIQQGQDDAQHANAYLDPSTATIEEGFTELGTINHAGEYLRIDGISGRATDMLANDDKGNSVDNPEFASAVRGFAGKVSAKRDELMKDQRAPYQHAARSLDAYIADLRAEPYSIKYGEEDGYHPDAITEVQHLGDPGLARWAQSMAAERKRIDMDIPPLKRATVAEVADRFNDPVRIANQDAWGHYGPQTAKALHWCQEVANAEGFGDRRKGTPGWARVQALSDEINRVGTGDKLMMMAEQVARAAGLPAGTLAGGAAGELGRHTPGIMSETDWANVQTTIRAEWSKGGGSAFRNAVREHARARLASQGRPVP